jgi:hypothetical protein
MSVHDDTTLCFNSVLDSSVFFFSCHDEAILEVERANGKQGTDDHERKGETVEGYSRGENGDEFVLGVQISDGIADREKQGNGQRVDTHRGTYSNTILPMSFAEGSYTMYFQRFGMMSANSNASTKKAGRQRTWGGMSQGCIDPAFSSLQTPQEERNHRQGHDHEVGNHMR